MPPGASLVTGGSNYLVRRSKTILCNVGIHMFPNEERQKHLVRDTKGQWGGKEKGGYRAEGEKNSCVKQDIQKNEREE